MFRKQAYRQVDIALFPTNGIKSDVKQNLQRMVDYQAKVKYIVHDNQLKSRNMQNAVRQSSTNT